MGKRDEVKVAEAKKEFDEARRQHQETLSLQNPDREAKEGLRRAEDALGFAMWKTTK